MCKTNHSSQTSDANQRSNATASSRKNSWRWRSPTVNEFVQAYEEVLPGQLTETPTQFEGPCPVCGGDDRFSIQKSDASIHCRGCNPDRTKRGIAAFKAILRVLGLLFLPMQSEAVEREMPLPRIGNPNNGPGDRQSLAKHSERAKKLWNNPNTVELRETESAEWLIGRGIYIFGNPDALKHMQHTIHDETKSKLPCMLAKVICPKTGEFMGLLRTFIPEVEPKRKNLGRIHGGGVLLAGELNAQSIVVTEGVEDALAIIQSGVKGAVWATCGAKHMPAFALNENVRFLIIAADNDKDFTGRIAAETLVDNWKKINPDITGRIVFPPQKYKDWNDMLLDGLDREIFERITFPIGKSSKNDQS